MRAGFGGFLFWYFMVEDFRCSTRAWRPLLDARPATAATSARRGPGDICSPRARQPRRPLLDARLATAARRAPGNRGEICSTRAWRHLLDARPARSVLLHSAECFNFYKLLQSPIPAAVWQPSRLLF